MYCRESSQPIQLYSSLAEQPLQLNMPSIAAAPGQEGPSPITLQLNLAACLQAGTAAATLADSAEPDTDAAAAKEQQQQLLQAALVSSSGSSCSSCVAQLLAGGNCQFELSGDESSSSSSSKALLLKVEDKPVGACQGNACRAISLLLGLPKGQCSVTAG